MGYGIATREDPNVSWCMMPLALGATRICIQSADSSLYWITSRPPWIILTGRTHVLMRTRGHLQSHPA